MKEALFGPAGFPVNGLKGEKAFEYLRKKGLFAMEYQAVRRLPKKKETMEKLGETAKKFKIRLSVHGPYAINLASPEKDKLETSKERLLNACRVADWMKAFHLTFHAGYYKGRSREETYNLVKEGIKSVVEQLKTEGINVEVSPETTGKPSQFGTVDEVVKLSSELDMVVPTIDFAHIHAREGGVIKSKRDYEKIFDKVEKELGPEVAKNLVIHFSEIEMVESGYGEKTHHDLGSGYGPDFKPLAEVIVETGLTPTIICETPSLDLDALKMKRIYKTLLRSKES